MVRKIPKGIINKTENMSDASLFGIIQENVTKHSFVTFIVTAAENMMDKFGVISVENNPSYNTLSSYIMEQLNVSSSNTVSRILSNLLAHKIIRKINNRTLWVNPYLIHSKEITDINLLELKVQWELKDEPLDSWILEDGKILTHEMLVVETIKRAMKRKEELLVPVDDMLKLSDKDVKPYICKALKRFFRYEMSINVVDDMVKHISNRKTFNKLRNWWLDTYTDKQSKEYLTFKYRDRAKHKKEFKVILGATITTAFKTSEVNFKDGIK